MGTRRTPLPQSLFTLFVVPAAYYWLCINAGSSEKISKEIAKEIESGGSMFALKLAKKYLKE